MHSIYSALIVFPDKFRSFNVINIVKSFSSKSEINRPPYPILFRKFRDDFIVKSKSGKKRIFYIYNLNPVSIQD